MRLQRNWRQDLQADTTILSQNLTFNGDVTLFEDWRLTVGSGYDFTAGEFTNTQVNLLWDLHCWEFSARWVPFGIQQSLQAPPGGQIVDAARCEVGKALPGIGLDPLIFSGSASGSTGRSRKTGRRSWRPC